MEEGDFPPEKSTCSEESLPLRQRSEPHLSPQLKSLVTVDPPKDLQGINTPNIHAKVVHSKLI